MNFMIWVAIGPLAVSVFLGLLRVMTTLDSTARAAMRDLVFFSCIGILAMFGILYHSSVPMDIVLLASIFGILATTALARIMTRGRR